MTLTRGQIADLRRIAESHQDLGRPVVGVVMSQMFDLLDAAEAGLRAWSLQSVGACNVVGHRWHSDGETIWCCHCAITDELEQNWTYYDNDQNCNYGPSCGEEVQS